VTEPIMLKDVCLRTRQWKPKTEPRDEFFYIDVSSVSNDTYSITTPQAVTGRTAPGRARKILCSRDVIYATIRPTLKRIALVPPQYDNHIASTAFCVVRADRAKSVPEFLYFLLLSDAVSKSIADAQHGASYPAVTDKDILKQEVPLPPLPEQKKIAAVLLRIQRAIETQDKILQSLRDLKKSTMQRLFTHGLRGEKTKVTEIGEIPESWEVVTLGDTCTFLSGGTPRKSRPEFWKGAIPWVSPKDMKTPKLRNAIDHISEEALDAGSCLSPRGSVFIVVRGMILMKDVPVALAEVPMAFNQDIKAIIPNENCDPEYLLFALQAFKQLLFQKVGRSAHGTRTIISDTLTRFAIPLPSSAEQRDIASSLRSIDEATAAHESKKAALQDIFRTALNKLMTGDIRAAGLDIDAAEVDA